MARSKPVKHKETAKHHEAFEHWYAEGRSYRETSQKLAVPERTLYQWAEWFGWEDRANKRDREAAVRADREAIKRRAEMLKRHRQAGELLTRRGIEHLAKQEIDATRDAISAIKTGVDLERQAEGMPTWVLEILNADEEHLHRLLGIVESGLAQSESAGDAAALRSEAVSTNGKH